MNPEPVTAEAECWRCNRCGYVWPTRGRHAPCRCARCASRYWAVERTRKRRNTQQLDALTEWVSEDEAKDARIIVSHEMPDEARSVEVPIGNQIPNEASSGPV